MVGKFQGSTLGFALLVAAVLAGCGSASSGSDDHPPGADGTPGAATDNPQSDPALTSDALHERPWEVVSNKGETYLANVFYADASENEQVMPTAIDGRAVIDRLVYPTLGNPNLYVKDDGEDELVMVLRIEDDAFAHLSPSRSPADGDKPVEITLSESDANAFAFYLVDRAHRSGAESNLALAPGAGVNKIVPKKILVNAEPADMPAAMKSRRTLRFVFDQAAMKAVPPGLYDARFEVKKDGHVFANVFEWQYNAVRVFDHAGDEYTSLSVTDTQVSVGGVYHTLTADKIDDFVAAVNASQDPTVRNAAFVTFNGDLHNGGSPGSLLQRSVATTYAGEAKRIVSALKDLSLPIFLTAGNHDGYSSTGVVPSEVKSIDNLVGDSLQKIVGEQNNIPWRDFSWDQYAAYTAKMATSPEGLHKDIITGGFARAPGDSFAASFKEVARADRNQMLYDGFHQWQRTYGPLYESWTFGKNRFVSLNTFELRQHRRSGWGMYTVNYGGGMSHEQLAWLNREIARAHIASEDMVLLMHHDPRGGHKGKDFGYYFPVLTFKSFGQSAINYLVNDKFSPLVCKLDDVQLTVQDQDGCLHDGLQEWMAPDPDFDQQGAAYFMSGIELLQRIIKSKEIRTLLIGHAHLNSMEILQHGDTLVPGKVAMDADSKQRLTWLEGSNPVRNHAWAGARNTHTTSSLFPEIEAWRTRLDVMLDNATPVPMRTLADDGTGPRELAILRLTSNADLSSERFGTQSMYGWSIMHITKQAAGTPRINRVSYFIHTGPDAFAKVETVDVDRTKSVAAKAPDNRVAQIFTW